MGKSKNSIDESRMVEEARSLLEPGEENSNPEYVRVRVDGQMFP